MDDKMEWKQKDEALEEILSYYSSMASPASQETIVAMLREIQELKGFISPEHKAMAAEAAGVKVSVIDCIMKLYKSLKPAAYEHRITVCTGARCKGGTHQKAWEKNLEKLKKTLGIKGHVTPAGALSADGTILLETRDCLKQCRTAPNLLFDGEPVADTEAFIRGLCTGKG